MKKTLGNLPRISAQILMKIKKKHRERLLPQSPQTGFFVVVENTTRAFFDEHIAYRESW